MDTTILFRKRTPMTEWGLPWLSGAEEHPWPAKRNLSGRAAVSAILVRSLLSTLEGGVHLAEQVPGEGVLATVASHSTPGAVSHCWLDWSRRLCAIPHGAPGKATYHLGVLAIVEALAEPLAARDFWEAYIPLLENYQAHGKDPAIKEHLCRAADELYYWLRFKKAAPEPAHCRLQSLEAGSNGLAWPAAGKVAVSAAALTSPNALRSQIGLPLAAPAPAASPAPAAPAPEPGGFVGWQAAALAGALAGGENVLLAGPTGVGKTFALYGVVQTSDLSLVAIEGKEGLTDLDFLGAILPQPDGGRAWVDGPLLRAMRLAQFDPTLLFLDEVNRIPRVHLNLLLGMMTPKSGAACRKMGLAVTGDGPFYVVEVPMTSEVVCCPIQHLRIVAAGNFGRAYQVYDLDPAVRRRFDTVIEFEYLAYADELSLLRREVPDLAAKAAEALVKLAQETRRLLANGELPGCVDTASLLAWGRKCARARAGGLQAVMKQAGLTWADQVCGRDHTGRVNAGSFSALSDYLESLKILPA